MSAPLVGKVQISAVADLSALSFQQLTDLQEALDTTSEVLSGLISQPRFEQQRRVLNAAGEFLDDLGRMIDVVAGAIFNEARKRPATTSEDMALKFGIIAGRLVSGGDEPGDVLAEIARVVSELGRGEPS